VRLVPPQLSEDMQTVCALAPIAGEQRLVAATLDLGHGRIERGGSKPVRCWSATVMSRVSRTCRKESARS
jgi:hypothetical protein